MFLKSQMLQFGCQASFTEGPMRAFATFGLLLGVQRLQILCPPRLQRDQLLVVEMMLLRVDVVLHELRRQWRKFAQTLCGLAGSCVGAGGGGGARVGLVVVVNRDGHRVVALYRWLLTDLTDWNARNDVVEVTMRMLNVCGVG